MQIKDELISKATAGISILAMQDVQNEIATIISITSAIISLSYTLYKWYERIRNSKNKLKELDKILKEEMEKHKDE